MHEDKLTPEQRIRLEAIAQANIRMGSRGLENPTRAIGDLIVAAERIAEYITNGRSGE